MRFSFKYLPTANPIAQNIEQSHSSENARLQKRQLDSKIAISINFIIEDRLKKPTEHH